MMTPTKCVRTATTGGWVPEKVDGHSWFAVKVEHIHTVGSQTTWALVLDETTTSPTEADIDRRVRLIRRAATVTTAPTFGGHGYQGFATNGARFWIMSEGLPVKWESVTAEDFDSAVGCFAVRLLLSERGAR
jgi:ABC-type sugar transport system ATPase subunit